MKVKIQKVVDLELVPEEFHKEIEPLFRRLATVVAELDKLQTQAPLLASFGGAEVVCVGIDKARRALYEVDNVLDGWLAIALDLHSALKEEEEHQDSQKEEEDGN
jgi:hypothetical protein